MNPENKEFYDLLNALANQNTFDLSLSPREEPFTVKCKHLTTAQLKELVKTVVDSPITQAAFNTAASKVFKQCIVNPPPFKFNVIDRLLFIIEARIASLSPTMTVTQDNKTFTVDFLDIKQKLSTKLKENSSILASSSATEGNVTVTYGVVLLDTEMQLNEELYKNIKFDVENPEDLRKLLGDAFINEIAKVMQTVTIGEKCLELTKISFKQRLQIIETLSASLIQKVIGYIEAYKKVIDECLQVNGQTLTIDGSIFSMK